MSPTSASFPSSVPAKTPFGPQFGRGKITQKLNNILAMRQISASALPCGSNLSSRYWIKFRFVAISADGGAMVPVTKFSMILHVMRMSRSSSAKCVGSGKHEKEDFKCDCGRHHCGKPSLREGWTLCSRKWTAEFDSSNSGGWRRRALSKISQLREISILGTSVRIRYSSTYY
jgi:hypothetical protein